MKFGRYLELAAYPEVREHYIAYKDLKKAIKVITGADATSFTINEVASNFGNIPALAGSLYRPPESRFQDLLNHELKKVNTFYTSTYEAVLLSFKAILAELSDGNGAAGAIPKLQAVASQILMLESFQRWNFTGFRKITKKYDKHNKSTSCAWYMARVQKEAFMTLDTTILLCVLSQAAGRARQAGLVCHVFNLGSSTGSQEESLDRSAGSSHVTQVHSVVDADSAEACSRRSSALASEEAMKPSLKPLPLNEKVTHSKFLVDADDSIKVKIYLSMMYMYLVPEHLHEAVALALSSNQGWKNLDKFMVSRHQCARGVAYMDSSDLKIFNLSVAKHHDSPNVWRVRWFGPLSATKSKSVVLELADVREPSYHWSESNSAPTERDLLLSVELLSAMMQGRADWSTVAKHCRSDAQRSLAQQAFEELPGLENRIQIWSSRNVFRDGSFFITLDENVRLVRYEKDQALMPYTEVLSGDFSRPMEFSLLDISALESQKKDKTSALRHIMGLPTVTELFAFTPYAHALYSLAADSEQGALSTPSWFKFLLKESLKNKVEVTQVKVDVKPSTLLPQKTPELPISLELAADDESERGAPSEHRYVGLRNMSELREPLMREVRTRSHGNVGVLERLQNGAVNVFDCLVQSIFSQPAPLDSREASKTTVRVEPKTFFANERTLLQWMNTAVLISTISITLLNLGSRTSRVGGLILSPVAIFFLVYSYRVYWRRSQALERKEAIDYNDRFGPTVLVVSLVAALSMILILNIWEMLDVLDNETYAPLAPTPLPSRL